VSFYWFIGWLLGLIFVLTGVLLVVRFFARYYEFIFINPPNELDDWLAPIVFLIIGFGALPISMVFMFSIILKWDLEENQIPFIGLPRKRVYYGRL